MQKKSRMNKKAIAPIFTIMIIILILLSVYIFLYIPIPAFTKLRMIVNYFLIIMFWVVLQILLIYAYVKLGKFVTNMVVNGYGKIHKWSLKVEYYLISR